MPVSVAANGPLAVMLVRLLSTSIPPKVPVVSVGRVAIGQCAALPTIAGFGRQVAVEPRGGKLASWTINHRNNDRVHGAATRHDRTVAAVAATVTTNTIATIFKLAINCQR